ncbi:patatin-like phospholipase [Hokovirus HKV1]|mgnify:CR=1 FL=1|uniref:Patatin-like phospholipase n=1 Tax=Hokovirus HKV1 TaxID=1977638 RepID=A0A1V0SF81_9VIRU|nr:patatin-like phospholipase [Hokovirus HKV1]
MQHKILSLDGGGMKGISLAMILIHIFEELEKKTGQKYEPCQIFDTFAGTSTGGLLSMFIGLKRHELKKSLNLYMGSDPNFLRPSSKFNLLKDLTKYDSQVALETYKYFFGEEHIDKYQASEIIPHMVVSALRIDKVPTETYIFKNFGNNLYNSNTITNFYLYEMARSTSAAPTYWNAYTRDINTLYDLYNGKNIDVNHDKERTLFNNAIKKHANRYSGIDEIKNNYDTITQRNTGNDFIDLCKNTMVLVDGGLGANNPALIGLSEISNLTTTSNINDISFLLSIGCGNIETTDSNHYAKYRKINNDNEKNNLCIDLLEIITNILYEIYKTIKVKLNNYIKEIKVQDAQKTLNKIFEKNKYNLNIDDINFNAGSSFMSIKDFTLHLIKTLLDISTNIITKIGDYLLNICFNIPDMKAKFENTNFSGQNKVAELYVTVQYSIKAFYFACKFFNSSIFDYNSLILKNINEITDHKLLIIYSDTQKRLQKIINNPVLGSELNIKIIKFLINNNKNLLLNIKNNISNFLEENLVQNLTGGSYEANICQKLLKNNFIRLSPIYEYKIDLAETKPVNLRKMMLFTKKYIQNNSNLINDAVNQIQKNMHVRDNVVPFTKFDSAEAYGYNIRNNVKYMKGVIYDILDVSYNSVPLYLSKKILSTIIKLYYQIYYEANYCYLNALVHYYENDILDENPGEFILEYMVKTEKVTKKYTYIELNKILNGYIDITKYYDLTTLQLGGNKFVEGNEYMKKYEKTMFYVKEFIKKYESPSIDEHINILQDILDFTIKIDNDNSLCYNCLPNNSCTSITNNTEKLSDTSTKWNTCKNLMAIKTTSRNKYTSQQYTKMLYYHKQNNIILKNYYSRNIAKGIKITAETRTTSVILKLSELQLCATDLKLRIQDPILDNSQHNMEYIYKYTNKQEDTIIYTKYIYAYYLLNPNAKNIVINAYFLKDKKLIYPLTTVTIANPNFYKLYVSGIDNNLLDNYKSLLCANNYLKIRPYYIYDFDNISVNSRIDYSISSFKYRDTYNLNNNYYYTIQNKYNSCIVVKIDKNINLTQIQDLILNIIDTKTLEQKLRVTSHVINKNDKYYCIFDLHQNILINAICHIELYYHNQDKFLSIYNSSKNSLLFHFE